MRIAFRTEGNHGQGMGDVWGSLALAREFSRGSDEVIFIVSGGEEAVAAVRGQGYPCLVAPTYRQEAAPLREFRPDVIIVNKLNNALDYLRFLKALAPFLVTIDDTGEGTEVSDLKFNVLYEIPGAITDWEYLPLREEFIAAHTADKEIRPQVSELLIAQGGSDTYGQSPRILLALERAAARPRCTVVVGPAFRHETELKKAVTASSFEVRVLRSPGGMASLMVEADLAITAGGILMLELCCVGTPGIVVCGDRWEIETADRLEREGAVVNLGSGLDLDFGRIPLVLDALCPDSERRKSMSAAGKRLVDGRGCERMARMIRERMKGKQAIL